MKEEEGEKKNRNDFLDRRMTISNISLLALLSLGEGGGSVIKRSFIMLSGLEFPIHQVFGQIRTLKLETFLPGLGKLYGKIWVDGVS